MDDGFEVLGSLALDSGRGCDGGTLHDRVYDKKTGKAAVRTGLPKDTFRTVVTLDGNPFNPFSGESDDGPVLLGCHCRCSTHTYTHTHAHTHTHTHTYIYTHMHARTHTYTRTNTYPARARQIHTCLHTHTHTHTSHTHTHTYTHICIHSARAPSSGSAARRCPCKSN